LKRGGEILLLEARWGGVGQSGGGVVSFRRKKKQKSGMERAKPKTVIEWKVAQNHTGGKRKTLRGKTGRGTNINIKRSKKRAGKNGGEGFTRGKIRGGVGKNTRERGVTKTSPQKPFSVVLDRNQQTTVGKKKGSVKNAGGQAKEKMHHGGRDPRHRRRRSD